MMNTLRHSLLLALALFAVSSMLFFDFVTMPAEAVTITIYNNTVQNSGRAISGNINNAKFDGEEITATSSLINQTFNRLAIYLRSSGDVPCGYNAYIGIWSTLSAPTSANMLKTIATVEVCDIPSAATLYTYNFNAHTLSANQAIGAYYGDDPTGSSNQWLSLRYSTTDQYNGSSTQHTYHNNNPNGWFDVATEDITMTLYWTEAGVGSDTCPEDSACYDTDRDGLIDFVIEDLNGDGIPDWTPAQQPLLQGRLNETAPAFLVAFGVPDVESSELLLGIMIPVVLMLAVVALTVTLKGNPTQIPAYVYGIVFMAGMGLSVIMGWLEPFWIVLGILGFAASFAGKMKGMF